MNAPTVGPSGTGVKAKVLDLLEQMVECMAGFQGVPERRCQQHLTQELFCTEVVKVSRSVLVPAKELPEIIGKTGVSRGFFVAPKLWQACSIMGLADGRQIIRIAATTVNLRISIADARPLSGARELLSRYLALKFC